MSMNPIFSYNKENDNCNLFFSKTYLFDKVALIALNLLDYPPKINVIDLQRESISPNFGNIIYFDLSTFSEF